GASRGGASRGGAACFDGDGARDDGVRDGAGSPVEGVARDGRCGVIWTPPAIFGVGDSHDFTAAGSLVGGGVVGDGCGGVACGGGRCGCRCAGWAGAACCGDAVGAGLAASSFRFCRSLGTPVESRSGVFTGGASSDEVWRPSTSSGGSAVGAS